MYNLNDIMNKAPALDNNAGAVTGNVLSGKTFWGLKAGSWGNQSGSMPNNGAISLTPGTTDQAIANGYHDGSGKIIGDADLVSANIKAGINLFGIDGNAAVVNTASGNATAGELLHDRTAWVNGQEVTGTRVGGVVLTAGGSFSPGKRWYDNADGTITDMTTGLIWLKSVSTSVRTFTATDSSLLDCVWYTSNLINGTSGLSDGSQYGDWRLPTLREMQSLRTGPEAIGAGSYQGFSVSDASAYWTYTHSSNDYRKVQTFNISTGAVVSESKNTFGGTLIYRLCWPVRNAHIR
jgi:hypothetical protein